MPVACIPHAMRETAGGSERVRVSGDNVRKIIQELELRYPGLKGRLMKDDLLQKGVAIAVDGKIVHRGLYEPVSQESEIHFFPALGGG
ncbi:MAG: MoaD/ThiS family protein [Arenicellales bacterium]|nr:MoaD/ThiS family protein [Arenicellales bacterium]